MGKNGSRRVQLHISRWERTEVDGSNYLEIDIDEIMKEYDQDELKKCNLWKEIFRYFKHFGIIYENNISTKNHIDHLISISTVGFFINQSSLQTLTRNDHAMRNIELRLD